MVATNLGSQEVADERHGWSLKSRADRLVDERYRIEADAVDGLARTRIARDTVTGERVVLKAVADERSSEADALGAIDHPGVVRLRRSGRDLGQAYLDLELIEGDDLESMLRAAGGRIDEARLKPLLRRLGDAVTAIHAAGYCHRDLKPANLVIGPDGTPVVVDLGAAARIEDGPPGAADSELTQGYAAPEQYHTDQPEGPWTDLYALGAIAYRALTGHPPEHPGGSLPPDCASPALATAIERALAPDPNDRPATVADWLSSLAPAEPPPAGTTRLDDYPPTIRIRRTPRPRGGATLSAPPPAAVPAPRRRRGGLIIATLLLAVLGAGVAAGAWYGRPLYDRYVKTEWVVDPAGGGDTLTIADALQRAGPGATIAVWPGTYAESLRIDQVVHLVAATNNVPVIAPIGGPCLVATSTGGSIIGFTFEGPGLAGGEPGAGGGSGATPVPCAVIDAGAIRLEGNLITGTAGPAIMVRNGATPAIAGNRIEAIRGPGIVIAAGAGGTVTQNQIKNVAEASVIVRSGATPTVIDNVIDQGGGVVFAEGAGGTFEGNRITASRASGIAVSTGADPSVVDNTIEGAGAAGIFVYDQGEGRFERNFVIGSRLSGVVVTSGASPRLAGNSIRENGEHGILVVEAGRATLARNAISANGGHGIAIDHTSDAELDANQLEGNQEPQLNDARVLE